MFISQYLEKPKYIKKERIKWEYLLLLVLMYFVFAMPLGAIGKIISNLLHITRELKDKGIQLKFWQVAIFAPFVEESLFRFLLKPKVKNLQAFLIISTLILIYLIWKEKYVIICALCSMQLISLLFLWKVQANSRKYYKMYLSKFKYLFYFSVIMFGFLHLTNFNYPVISIWIVLLSPFLILPQILMGGILGFIRMRWGLIYSILFHAFINSIAYVMTSVNAHIIFSLLPH